MILCIKQQQRNEVGNRSDVDIYWTCKTLLISDMALMRKYTKRSSYLIWPNVDVSYFNDHSIFGLSQWETTLHCNVISHWVNPCTGWCLVFGWRMCFDGISAVSPLGHDTWWPFLGLLSWYSIILIKSLQIICNMCRCDRWVPDIQTNKDGQQYQ